MKRVWLPLYGKILIWFFLNVVLLVGAFALLLSAQFRYELDWMLMSGARERIGAVRDLIAGELNVTPPDEWHHVLDRFSEAYSVRFALFDEDGTQLVGDAEQPPEEVRARMLPRTREAGERRPPEHGGGQGAEEVRRWRPGRAILRTTNPTRYWLMAGVRIDNPLAGDPLRVTLVARSSSIAAGGLIVDPTPWLAVGLCAVIFSLLFWFPLISGITRSIAQMTHATRQIADGRFDVRVNVRRRDELGRLSEAIDQMARRLDGFVAGQKRFLGDIAHELCSPLARLQMALGILEERTPAESEKYVQSASEKARQISELVAELLSFSKASYGASAVRLRAVNVREAVEEAVRRESVDGAEIRVEITGNPQVAADWDLLVRALANIVRNAIRHAGHGGPILVRAVEQGNVVIITIADSGPGIPESELSRIFDAFYRLDSSRTRDTGGTGLGLAIVKTCVESCYGTVIARNLDPRGLEVRVELPSAENRPDLIAESGKGKAPADTE